MTFLGRSGGWSKRKVCFPSCLSLLFVSAPWWWNGGNYLNDSIEFSMPFQPPTNNTTTSTCLQPGVFKSAQGTCFELRLSLSYVSSSSQYIVISNGSEYHELAMQRVGLAPRVRKATLSSGVFNWLMRGIKKCDFQNPFSCRMSRNHR